MTIIFRSRHTNGFHKAKTAENKHLPRKQRLKAQNIARLEDNHSNPDIDTQMILMRNLDI